jgi:hypothetical protein
LKVSARRVDSFLLRRRANHWSKAKLPHCLATSFPQASRAVHSHTPNLYCGAQFDCVAEGDVMSDQSSELVEISKLNGDFRRNYGKLIGAYLYLRSVSAARGRPWFWAGLLLRSARRAWLG